MQTGRATPTPTNSSVRNTNRPRKAKPAGGMSNKKRKHSTSTSPSHSGSQDAPSSNASGGEPPSLVLASMGLGCVGSAMRHFDLETQTPWLTKVSACGHPFAVLMSPQLLKVFVSGQPSACYGLLFTTADVLLFYMPSPGLLQR